MSRLVWIPPGGLELIGPLPPELEVVEIPADPRADPRLGEVEVVVPPPLIFFRELCGRLAESWNRMTSLRLVQTLSAGVDWIVDEIPPGVILASARGAHDVSVAEWIVGILIADAKDLPAAWRGQQEHAWRPGRVTRLAGSTVLLLGYGSIAKATEERLAAFDVEILRVARRAREGVSTLDALPALLPKADHVVVLLPNTPETKGIVGADFMKQMKPGALLVNAARGVIVDTGALVDALTEGRIRAAVDVTDPEPLPPDHPLWDAPGLIVTPHIAGYNPADAGAPYRVAAKQLERWASGEPLANVVEAGY